MFRTPTTVVTLALVLALPPVGAIGRTCWGSPAGRTGLCRDRSDAGPHTRGDRADAIGTVVIHPSRVRHAP